MRISYNSVSDSELIYATGLERNKFDIIYRTLEKFAPSSEIPTCSKKDSLLVTLFKIRHDLTFPMTGFIFGISSKIVKKIFIEMVDKLYTVLQQTDIWDIAFKNSRSFRNLLESTKVQVLKADGPSNSNVRKDGGLDKLTGDEAMMDDEWRKWSIIQPFSPFNEKVYWTC